MIGVIANAVEHDVVREFFELFKTPWEFYRSTRRYDVVLCSGAASVGAPNADLVILYAGGAIPFDTDAKIPIDCQQSNAMLSYRGQRLPLYGESLTFRTEGMALSDEASARPAACVTRSGDGVAVRIGYDLFREIRAALTVGQPVANAGLPCVDTHIAVLRDVILAWTDGLVEIPPVPDGYPFIACLTHDVDHPSIRRHGWDHTTFGFLYRAVLGSVIDVARGRKSVRSLLTNWTAAMTLPFVHLGLARDPWAGFDRYLAIEAGLRSTFFVIPFENDPGRTRRGPAPARRASRYGARDIADSIRRLASAGCEIGVHGLDAWHDSTKGRQELAEVAAITEALEVGARMHWLYADEHSPATLEKAGFVYDATSGYNETVGYRAGTTQVFKPLDAIRLLELPLHVMDTALFYPSHLHLAPRDAWRRVSDIIEHARHLGGTVTVNWHDRSIAPERLWGEFYAHVVDELKESGAWFATAGQAVAWFRRRRTAVFEAVSTESGMVRAKVSVGGDRDLPGVRLRIHRTRDPRRCGAFAIGASAAYVDIGVHGRIDARLPI